MFEKTRRQTQRAHTSRRHPHLSGESLVMFSESWPSAKKLSGICGEKLMGNANDHGIKYLKHTAERVCAMLNYRFHAAVLLSPCDRASDAPLQDMHSTALKDCMGRLDYRIDGSVRISAVSVSDERIAQIAPHSNCTMLLVCTAIQHTRAVAVPAAALRERAP